MGVGKAAVTAAGRAGREYLAGAPGSMGVDTSRGRIGEEWTKPFDVMGQDVQGRNVFAPGVYEAVTARALGQGPSAAGIQAAETARQLAGAQFSTALSGSNAMNRGALMRGAGRDVSAMGSNIAREAMAARINEMTQAQALSGQLGLQRQGLNDAMTQYYMSQGFTRDVAQQQAWAAMEQLIAQNWQASVGASSAAYGKPGLGTEVAKAGMSGLGTAGGTALAASLG